MSSASNIVVMDQLARNTIKTTVQEDVASETSIARTPLAHASGARADANGSQPVLTLLERPVSGLLTLRAVNDAKNLSDALHSCCQVHLPGRLESQMAGKYCVRWMSPDEWLLSCPLAEAFSIEQNLRESVGGHIAVVNVSGGYSILELKGPDARYVLMKSTGYDVHPDHFSSGKVVNTVFAKSQVTLRALADNHYEIVVRRSYSDYLWMWLQRAGKEYGMVFQAANL